MCSVEIEDEEVYISFVCILNLLEAITSSGSFSVATILED